MPRNVVLALMILFGVASVASGGDLGALDATNGFRDARFGAPLRAFDGLELVSEDGARGTRLYLRPADDLGFGSARLDGVTYGFYAGKLYFVTLFTSGRRNGRSALAELERRFGAGERVLGEPDEYVWRGRRVLLHYRRDPVTSLGMVALTSRPMNSRVERDLETAAANMPEN